MNRKIECISVGDIETNCWLYPLPENPAMKACPCVVIDPGDEATIIISRLQELNWIPRYIFLTHGHFDHLAALPDLIDACKRGVFGSGPLPQTGIHRYDAHYLGAGAHEVHRNGFAAAGGNAAYVDALWRPLPEADILFGEGDEAGPFRVLHLPGHTPGSIGLYDEPAGILFSGDILFRGTYGRTDLPGGSYPLLVQSLKRLLAMKGELVVCPGHGPATTIGEEREAEGNAVLGALSPHK